jgi:hypothetical protein
VAVATAVPVTVATTITSWRLNEAGLRRLLERPTGPVGQELVDRAERVTAAAARNSGSPQPGIGIRSGALDSGIHYEIEVGPPMRATVGTNAMSTWNGRPFSYPAYHDQVTGRPWLTGALREVFP